MASQIHCNFVSLMTPRELNYWFMAILYSKNDLPSAEDIREIPHRDCIQGAQVQDSYICIWRLFRVILLFVHYISIVVAPFYTFTQPTVLSDAFIFSNENSFSLQSFLKYTSGNYIINMQTPSACHSTPINFCLKRGTLKIEIFQIAAVWSSVPSSWFSYWKFLFPLEPGVYSILWYSFQRNELLKFSIFTV